MNCLGSLKRKIQLTQCGFRTLEPALAAMLNNVKTIPEAEGRGLFYDNKKATEINVSSPFSLCSLNGSGGLGTLTDRAVFTWKSKQYRFVFPKVLVA
jgi:hypothetical protein